MAGLTHQKVYPKASVNSCPGSESIEAFDANGEFARPSPPAIARCDVLQQKGAGKTILSGGYVTAIQMIATVALARLLTPPILVRSSRW